MFYGESPENYEQKCLCVLVLDVSSSMAGEPITRLNQGLQDFQKEILNDFVASKRLEVAIVTFSSNVLCIQDPALVSNFSMPNLATSGSTKMVDGLRLGLEILEGRKQYYTSTGQKYFRPMIVLMTDGEPDSDQDLIGISQQIAQFTAAKKMIFYSIGVPGYNHQKLAMISNSPPPLPLQGLEFANFFKWLSNSISIISKSREGEKLTLPSVTSWAQIEM